MNELLQEILNNPLPALAVIGNLIIIESLLSVDNAAVLATLVIDLPKEQRSRALRYGILGAYAFRGLAMIFASYLIGFWWLKPIGGLYLLWLVIDQFKHQLKLGELGSLIFRFLSLAALLFLIQNDGSISVAALWTFRILSGIYLTYVVYSIAKIKEDMEDDGEINKSNNSVYQFFYKKIGTFWSTVILVEIMDMAFSIDNVFAAVAFTPNILLIYVGVFIGILAMRFIAQWFVKLMEKYSFLETSAFIVIFMLSLKLLLALLIHYQPDSIISKLGEDSNVELLISVLTMMIFFAPIITSVLFNFPKRNETPLQK
jgi:YkoY family integral membrane protein